MARYMKDLQVKKSGADVAATVMNYLNTHGFKQKTIKNEVVWQAGVGLLTLPRFVKFHYIDNHFHLEAWTKMAWFPGVYTGESNLGGFYGVVPKQIFKGDIDALANMVACLPDVVE